MAIPLPTLKVYEKTQVDLAIDDFAKLESPTEADINRVRALADVQSKLDEYRFKALNKSRSELLSEGHSSKALAARMSDASDPRPSNRCDCHAMVSGKHKLAAPMRAIMAWCKARIDDPRNGCWLPRTYADKQNMPRWLVEAVPHQGLHNPRYYQWLNFTIGINAASINGLDDLNFALKEARTRLQLGTLRKDAWPKKKG